MFLRDINILSIQESKTSLFVYASLEFIFRRLFWIIVSFNSNFFLLVPEKIIYLLYVDLSIFLWSNFGFKGLFSAIITFRAHRNVDSTFHREIRYVVCLRCNLHRIDLFVQAASGACLSVERRLNVPLRYCFTEAELS